MSISTKRWNDPSTSADGWRILVCRYRPRALKKADETWDTWYPQLGPSKKLHADARGKNRSKPISRLIYKKRYLKEMQHRQAQDLIICLAKLVKAGGKITLLCSSNCTDEKKCHRSLLKKILLNLSKRM
jgi:uncharacterized protein YeaO (DUF488 family)